MRISDKLERRTLEVLLSTYDLPITNFRTYTYKEYLGERKLTVNGFIGYQVPRKGVDRTYRNDFVVYIPNKLDIRIECKSLAVISILSRAVIAEEFIITSSMPEENLVLLVEGDGFKTKEFLKTFKRTKNKVTTLVNNLNSLTKSLQLISN